MLQRAASNAYSWWWASHIRTKQSKWLEQSLQDMEEKVTVVLKMIEEDGDSFAKRAEMYYKKRPELIHFVEESYRAFRALAERYDLMSKELQNANSTLASAFPDRFQYAMDDDEDGTSPQMPRRNPKQSPNIPNVPKHFPAKNIKAIMALTPKPGVKKAATNNGHESGSGMSKEGAVDEIDRLQKVILTKQTEKEFTKSSYESGVAKYWEIEQEIIELQKRVSVLQDEYGVGKEIEDDEARCLMLEAALKSCQDTLAGLQEKQERSASETREERQKIKIAREKLLSLKGEVFGDSIVIPKEEEAEEAEEEIELARENIKKFEVDSSVSVSEMADKIDGLVSKVISLEVAVSSQTAAIVRLRVENDELQQQIQSLEDDKANLIDGKNTLDDKLKELEDKLRQLQELEQSVDSKNNILRLQFTDTAANLDEISHRLPSVKPDEEIQVTAIAEVFLPTLEEPAMKTDVHKDFQAENTIPDQPAVELQDPDKELIDSSSATVSECDFAVIELEEELKKDEAEVPTVVTEVNQPEEEEEEEEEEPNWQQLFMNGLEGKEKVILNEYTSILRNYKEVKKRLGEVENKGGDSLMELRELKLQNANKDEEIQSLRHKLILLQQRIEELNNTKQEHKTAVSPEEEDDVISFIVEEPRKISPVEEKLRADIDEILEENLDFWMRFSSSFSQVQKLQSEIEDLQKELVKIENEKKRKDGSSTPDQTMKSDARPIYKHLKEIQTELTVWLDKSVELKDELKCRFSQLCRIQEDITRALSDGAIDEEMKFTSFQAAKFQGEVLNMQQENQKVEDELQAAVDHLSSLQIEVERTISRLNEELGISGSKSSAQMVGGSRNRIPLRAFIFGSKIKRPRHSLLSSMQPSWHKKH
ncbi:hypothetical protein V2J09_008855 [Rumex salicifolius]